jgi:cephalosporin hydroxylase
MRAKNIIKKAIGKKTAKKINASYTNRIANQFHKIYYDSGVWGTTYWLGVPFHKCPLDAWLYQEMLYTLKPDLIIETGTANGGSALYFASMFDLLEKGQILTIDIEANKNRPQHPRITYLQGSSIAPEIIETAHKYAEGKKVVLVSLDSDHSKAHVLKEMELYGKLVSEGSYMVVEDTNVNGHPVLKDFGEGPYEAVEEFMKTHNDFSIDYALEKFFFSFNTHGYLKKCKRFPN